MNADGVIGAIRAHCLSQPGAVEEHPWGDNVWKVRGRIFAMGGGSGVTVKATPDDQPVLIQHPAVSRAAYVGRFGWVRVEITDEESLQLALDLIDASYALVAAPRKKR